MSVPPPESSDPSSVPVLRRRRRRRSEDSSLTVVVVGVATTVICTFPLFLTGALAVQMRAELGFSVTELGIAAALFRASGALFAVPFGALADRIGPSRAMRYAAGISTVTSLGIGLLARDIIALYALLFLGGLANPLGQSAANLSLSRSVQANRQGLAFGLKQSALPLSSLIAGLAVPLIALSLGWRYGFVAAAGLAIWLILAIPSGEAIAFRTRAQPETTSVTRRWPLFLLAAGLMVSMMAGSTLTTFTVDSAVTSGVSPATAGLLLTIGSLASIVVRLIVGSRADRRERGHFRTVAGLVAFGSIGYLLLAVGGPILTTIGVIVAFGLGWGFNGLFWYALLRLNRQAPGRITGLVMPGGMLGGFLGPLIFGWIVDTSGYGVAWTVAGVWGICGAAIIMVARRMVVAGLAEQRAERT